MLANRFLTAGLINADSAQGPAGFRQHIGSFGLLPLIVFVTHIPNLGLETAAVILPQMPIIRHCHDRLAGCRLHMICIGRRWAGCGRGVQWQLMTRFPGSSTYLLDSNNRVMMA